VVSKYIYTGSFIYALPIFPVLGFSFLLTMYRFWRTPSRKVLANGDDLASPADGNIIYIKSIDAGEVPISIKNGLEAKISEITETDLLNQGGWLIGINMTPFDVHKNCAPITGRIILNKHINGEFLSLKEPTALVRNERNTLVIETETGKYFGIVQTASKLVKRIDSYVKVGQEIERGDWFGMIRFGSQVDLIIPNSYTINVSLGQQVYAKTTTIASHADTI
jgi:phosphatidylserine decarboxylase